MFTLTLWSKKMKHIKLVEKRNGTSEMGKKNESELNKWEEEKKRMKWRWRQERGREEERGEKHEKRL